MSTKLVLALSLSLGIGVTVAIFKFEKINIFIGPQYHQPPIPAYIPTQVSPKVNQPPIWIEGTVEDPNGPKGNNWGYRQDPCGPPGNNWRLCP